MMKRNYIPLVQFLVLSTYMNFIFGMNFEFRSFESPITSQAQIACQANNIKANGNYICTKFGEIVCLFGWKNESSLCSEPICSQKCDLVHGKCTAPNTCTLNPMNVDVHLDGKEHFAKSLYVRPGCLNGFCSSPEECLCKPGWKGDKCDICEKLPGCSLNGECQKPLECNCKKGWKGNFCELPICHSLCHSINGYCFKPNECWCHIGWEGEYCQDCRPYPGCKGKCEKPWECKCLPGQSGPLCDSSPNFMNNTLLEENILSNEENTLNMDIPLLNQTNSIPILTTNDTLQPIQTENSGD
ncbi:unnamed protein product [Lepeophtheirus salmonis]|uniref:(salmon louse) hypothetical protein n=1 Tax=Lepeophtheirus salmonis TaxID=72036 RepID=A0A7R8D2V9_LEPSM|nr:unnamed protein product [Lepeophtheirus salmonis]CAF2959703.1 unnamed protein product [Lepeophtheirus salmonis]